MAEHLIYNAHILKVSSDDTAEAVAFKDGCITFVGTSAEGLSRDIPPQNRVNLNGAVLIPGFNDNHLHLHSTADILTRPQLHGLSRTQIIELLKEQYREITPGQVISGMGWDYPDCPDPDKSLLDKEFPNHPVVLFQFSGHGAWVNSRMLKLMGITSSTPNPAGGEIVRDGSGNPTGILKDEAVTPLHNLRLKEIRRRKDLRRQLFDTAQDFLVKTGITSIQDNTWHPATARDMAAMVPYDDLKMRINCWAYGSIFRWNMGMRMIPFSGEWVRRGPVKYFLDGTFSTRTAWLKEEYADQPGNFGTPSYKAADIERFLRTNTKKGRQTAYHVIGDQALHALASAAEKVQKEYPDLVKLRIRAEHSQLIDRKDLTLMQKTGMLASAQPHAMWNFAKDRALLGEERAAGAYPYRSLLDAGIPLSFGSDVPGEATYAPLYGIHLAVSRESPEAITPLEALRAYTLGSAYAEFMEDKKGSIDVGKLADFTILAEDPTSINPAKIRDIEVLGTYVGGRQVYSADKA